MDQAFSDRNALLASIPRSQSDELLRNWGFDLFKETLVVLEHARLDPRAPVLELAAGSGRTTALLTRLGHRVIAGDLDFSRLPDLRRRTGGEHLHLVSLVKVNMERLAFRDHAAAFITCVNTLHEVDDPDRCLSELVRVHGSPGTLVLMEFNDEGFDRMQRLHEAVYQNDHTRGTVSHATVRRTLEAAYESVQIVETPLNTSYIATGKRFPQTPAR